MEEQFIPRILNSLPLLLDLELDTVKFGHTGSERNHPPPTYSLATLTLKHVTLGVSADPTQELILFLSLFRQVGTLRILTPFLRYEHADQDNPIDGFELGITSVRGIDLSMKRLERFLPHYGRMLRLHDLREVTIAAENSAQLAALGTFLGQAGPAITTFKFNLPKFYKADVCPLDGWKPLNLSTCSALQTIILQVFAGNTVYAAIASMFECVFNILKCHPTPSLTCLILEGIAGTSNKEIIHSFQQFNWGLVDDHLAVNYPQLSTVTFHFTEVHIDPDYRGDAVHRPMIEETNFIIDHLPRCRKRGVLRFVLEGGAVSPSPLIIIPNVQG